MALEYQTYTFEDTAPGRNKMERMIQEMGSQGWRVHSKETSQQGYDAGKTCCLGCLFLPLALLGKKNSIITVIFERDVQPDTTEGVIVDKKLTAPKKTTAKHNTPEPKRSHTYPH